MPTYNLLSNMNGAIRTEFKYAERYEEGTQAPLETLDKMSGTCRDFALLFMEGRAVLASAPASSPAISTTRRSTAAATQGAGDACLGGDLSAGRRLGGIRPDQRADRGRKSDSRRGHARPFAGDPDFRHLQRRVPPDFSGSRWTSRSAGRARARAAPCAFPDRNVHLHAVAHDDVARPLAGGAGAEPFGRIFMCVLPRRASRGSDDRRSRVEVTSTV